MKNSIRQVLCTLSAILLSLHSALAAPAVEVLSKDYGYPNKIEGFPAKLSDL